MTARSLLIAFAAALIVLVGIASPAAAAPEPKVDICHIPPGNPDNFHTITVGQGALAAHLAHGDIGGPCDGACAALCDDGDACTVDDMGDCEAVGCPTTSVPVDCDDGSACTEDSCDSATGCVNTPLVCEAPDLCTISECAPDTGECVDSAVVCPDGYVCNPQTGECDDATVRDLLGPDIEFVCAGEPVGIVNVTDLGVAGLQVEVTFENGPPEYSAPVYWVCTTVPGGCHGDACGFTDLGTITTDAGGAGYASFSLPAGNPYPGQYVHFDIGPPWYTSITHIQVFPTNPAKASADAPMGSGDPTD